jgi:hydrogenase small subunit
MITRRQFLKLCTASAAAMGFSEFDLLKLKEALAQPNTNCVGYSGYPVIWLSGQACSGCPSSLLNRVVDCDQTGYYDADIAGLQWNGAPVPQGTPSDPAGTPLNVVHDAADLLVGDAVGTLLGLNSVPPAPPPGFTRALTWASFPNGYIDLDWMITVNAGMSDLMVDNVLAPIGNTPGGFVLLVDGSIPFGRAGRFCLVFDDPNSTTGAIKVPGTQSVSVKEALRWLAPNAIAVIAVGACASFGGIPGAKWADYKSGVLKKGNHGPTRARSVKYALDKWNITTPVVNCSGCPPQPDWIVYPIAYFIVNGSLPPLDADLRPRAMYPSDPGITQCQNCPRDGQPYSSELGNSNGNGCNRLVGCKGWKTQSNCSLRRHWMRLDDGTKNNWCVGGPRAGTNAALAADTSLTVSNGRYVCHGCVQRDFPDGQSPFFEEV